MKVALELSIKAKGKRIPVAQLQIDIALKETVEMLNNVEVTKREAQVRELLVRGMQHKEIASALNISTRTVKFHAGTLYKKYGVANRQELALKLLSCPEVVA